MGNVQYVVGGNRMRESMKRMWTVAALLAMAAIPIVILAGKKEQKPVPVAADANDIFEWELKES
jgi:hypothetical protein